MLICKNCNSKVSETQRFCQNCGAISDSFVRTEEEAPVNTETQELAPAGLGTEDTVALVPETEKTVAAGPEAKEPATANPELVIDGVNHSPKHQETIIAADYHTITKKKSKKPIIIGLVIVILALLAVSAFAMKDMFKSPKQRYIDAESKYFTGAIANIKAETEKATINMNKKYEQKMNLTVSPDFSSFIGRDIGADTATISKIGEIIKDIAIETDTKMDNANKAFVSDFNIKLKGNVLINGTMAMDKDKELFKFPQFYDKTFVINLNELDKIYENLGINNLNMPEKVLQTQDIKDAIKIDNAALSADCKKYAQIYFDAIPQEQIKADKESLAIKNINIACRKLTISMKKADLVKLLENLVHEAEKDDVLKQLVYGNAKNLMELFKEAGYFAPKENDIEIESMFTDSNYAEFFSTLKTGIQEMKDNQNIADENVMTIWVNNEGDIIKREIKSSVVADDSSIDILYSGTEYYSDTLIQQNYSIKLADKSGTDHGSFSVVISRDSEKPKKDSKEGSDQFMVVGELTGASMDSEKVNLRVNSKKKMVDNVLNVDTEFTLDSAEFNASGTVDLKKSENEKLKESTDKYDINLKIKPSSDSEDVIKGNIKLDLITKTDVIVDLSGLLTGDTVELDKLDSTQMGEIGTEIQQKAMEFILLNQNMFKEFLN